MKNNFEVHVYQTTMSHKKRSFKTEALAVDFAQAEFKKPLVYKVKVWGLSKGKPERSKQSAPALLLHLV